MPIKGKANLAFHRDTNKALFTNSNQTTLSSQVNNAFRDCWSGQHTFATSVCTYQFEFRASLDDKHTPVF
jgi:hypothetical protein